MTPFIKAEELAKSLHIDSLYIKDESQNASGSHKDRAIWVMMERYLKEGKVEFVISSSGNAAISAAYYVRNAQDKNIKLHVFVSPKMPDEKRKRLDEAVGEYAGIEIHVSKKAKSEAFQFAKEHDVPLLRTSTDEHATEGYHSLSDELVAGLAEFNTSIDDIDIFIPTSSGTTAEGIYNGLVIKERKPRIHVVQTTRVCPIAKEFDQSVESADSSLASAIVDTIGHRKDRVVQLVKESGGYGWVITDKELEEARKQLEAHTDFTDASWDSLLSLAGLIKAINSKKEIKKAVLLFTGK